MYRGKYVCPYAVVVVAAAAGVLIRVVYAERTFFFLYIHTWYIIYTWCIRIPLVAQNRFLAIIVIIIGFIFSF